MNRGTDASVDATLYSIGGSYSENRIEVDFRSREIALQQQHDAATDDDNIKRTLSYLSIKRSAYSSSPKKSRVEVEKTNVAPLPEVNLIGVDSTADGGAAVAGSPAQSDMTDQSPDDNSVVGMVIEEELPPPLSASTTSLHNREPHHHHRRAKDRQVDFYRNPTVLSRLILNQMYDAAIQRVQEHPDEAAIWVASKRKHKSQHQQQHGDSSSADWMNKKPKSKYSIRLLPIHLACANLSRTVDKQLRMSLNDLINNLVVTNPKGSFAPDHQGRIPIFVAVYNGAGADTISIFLTANPDAVDLIDPMTKKTLLEINRYRVGHDKVGIEKLLRLGSEFWKKAHQEAQLRLATGGNSHRKGTSSDQVSSLLPLASRDVETDTIVSADSDEIKPSPGEDDDLDTIPSLAWNQLEQRAIATEQMLVKVNQENYNLNVRIADLSLKHSSSMEMEELRRKNMELSENLKAMQSIMRRTLTLMLPTAGDEDDSLPSKAMNLDVKTLESDFLVMATTYEKLTQRHKAQKQRLRSLQEALETWNISAENSSSSWSASDRSSYSDGSSSSEQSSRSDQSPMSQDSEPSIHSVPSDQPCVDDASQLSSNHSQLSEHSQASNNSQLSDQCQLSQSSHHSQLSDLGPHHQQEASTNVSQPSQYSPWSGRSSFSTQETGTRKQDTISTLSGTERKVSSGTLSSLSTEAPKTPVIAPLTRKESMHARAHRSAGTLPMSPVLEVEWTPTPSVPSSRRLQTRLSTIIRTNRSPAPSAPPTSTNAAAASALAKEPPMKLSPRRMTKKMSGERMVTEEVFGPRHAPLRATPSIDDLSVLLKFAMQNDSTVRPSRSSEDNSSSSLQRVPSTEDLNAFFKFARKDANPSSPIRRRGGDHSASMRSSLIEDET